MRKLFLLTCALFLFVGVQAQLTNLTTSFNTEKLIGHWEFASETEPLKATVGTDLTAVNDPAWAEVDGIGTMRFDYVAADQSTANKYLKVAHGFTADTHSFAIMLDIKIDLSKGDGANITSLYRPSGNSDGRAFVGFDNSATNRKNAIGLGTYTTEMMNPGGWNRVIINASSDWTKMHMYVVHPDGTLYENKSCSNGNIHLRANGDIQFFADEDNENGRLNVSQIAFFNTSLTDAEIEALTTYTLPKVSTGTGDEGPWYIIQTLGQYDATKNRQGLCFTSYYDTTNLADAANSVEGLYRVAGAAMNPADLASQSWRLLAGTDGSYKLQNRSNNKIVTLSVPTSPTITKTEDILFLTDPADVVTAGEIDILKTMNGKTPTDGYFFLKAASTVTNASKKALHQSNELGVDNTNFSVILTSETASWGTGLNSQFRFIEIEDFFVSDTEMNFGEAAIGSTPEKSLAIAISDAITGTLECILNDETGAFSIDDSGLDASKGGALKVKFTPTAAWKTCEAAIEVKIDGQSKFITLSGSGKPSSEIPTISNAANGNVWYYVTMPRNGGDGKSFTTGEIGGNITRKLINKEDNKNQIWKLIDTEVADKYKLMDVSGNSVKLNGKLISAVAEEGMSLGIQSNTSLSGVVAVSLMTGANATQHLDQQSDEVGTWGEPAGSGAAVTFIIAPEDVYTDITTAAFGEVAVGESSTAATIFVTGVNLDETHTVTYTIEGADASAFAAEKGTDWADLYGGELNITFTPTEGKAYSAKLILTTGTETTEVELTGTGLQDPTIVADPSADLAFGDVVLNKKAIKTISVKGLNLSDNVTYVKSGADADIFTIDESDWTGEATGSELKVTVLPTEEKEYTATIVFSATGANDITITLTAKGYTTTLPVTLSTDTEENWYYIYAERGKAYIQGFGANKSIAGRASEEGADGQLWKFVDTEFSGQYKVVNKAGGELAYTKDAITETTVIADRMYMAENSTNTFDFVASGEKWQLKCNELREGAGSFINKTNNSWEFCQYYVDGDGGNLMSFIPQAEMTEFLFPKVSLDTEEFWYYIQFERNADTANAPEGLVVQSNGADANMTAGAKTENATNQYWKITGTDGNYVLTNYDGLSVKLGTDAFQVIATDENATADALEILPAFSGDYQGALTIKRKETTANNGFNPSGGSRVGNKIAEYGVNDGGSALKFIVAPAIVLSNDATLKSLSVSVGELTPGFSPETTAYTVNVENQTSITIEAEANNDKATIEGIGEIALVPNANMLTITVTAEDGTKKNYSILVSNLPLSGINGPDASLNISAINGILTVTFDGTRNVKLYTTTGILVDNTQADASYVKALNDGIYVLVIDGISYKVLVK